MNFVGIDPGQKGAVSVLFGNGKYISGKTIVFYDMPLLPERGIDGLEIVSMLKIIASSSDTFCVIEKAQPMPSQGSVSGFSYGIGYGKILCALEFLQIPFQEIHPLKWKKEFGIISKRGKTEPKLTISEKKKLSLKVATQLFPSCKEDFFTQRKALLDGRVEALLLAEYARRIYK